MLVTHLKLRKVLVVIDDTDDVAQLEEPAAAMRAASGEPRHCHLTQ